MSFYDQRYFFIFHLPCFAYLVAHPCVLFCQEYCLQKHGAINPLEQLKYGWKLSFWIVFNKQWLLQATWVIYFGTQWYLYKLRSSVVSLIYNFIFHSVAEAPFILWGPIYNVWILTERDRLEYSSVVGTLYHLLTFFRLIIVLCSHIWLGTVIHLFVCTTLVLFLILLIYMLF
jgi:hypothetical protein